jgi:short-subunit dehydrogenase
VNAICPLYLIKVLLKKQFMRSKRSGILIVTSGIGTTPASGVITYSAAKAFSRFLGQGLNYELKDKIDVISFICGRVATKFGGIDMHKMKTSFTLISPDKATKCSLRDLGIGSDGLTWGAAGHDIGIL